MYAPIQYGKVVVDPSGLLEPSTDGILVILFLQFQVVDIGCDAGKVVNMTSSPPII